jgi:anti-sigma factor RsiW
MEDLECREFVELVTGYLEGTLDPPAQERVAEHLTMCEGCTGYLAQMTTTVDTLRSVPSEQLPAEIRAALLEAFAGRAE